MDLGALALDLATEAATADERRLLVLAGDHDAGYDAVRTALDAVDADPAATVVVGPRDELPFETLTPRRADRLLGTTRDVVVLDAHDTLRPNALGQVVGAVDGGGLLVLLTPTLDSWPDERDGFDETLAVPPFAVDDVTGNFRTRLVETLRSHPGVAIVDVDADRIERDGLTDPPPRRPTPEPDPPADHTFPAAAYETCLTDDQAAVLHEFEGLYEPARALVVEADRGRGKSSAAGLAAGCFAAEGWDVLVTAPAYRNAREVFVRAAALLADLDELADDEPRRVESRRGGTVRFAPPVEAADLPGDPDVVLVDEAAAIPVRLLESFLAADRVAFATTVHGYEGAGRGFSVRFRDRLAESRHEVTEARLDQPIRYAAGDPVEVWAFRALLLDARPPVDPLVADAAPETVEYRRLSPTDLLADENLLREAFGLLVLAHYRTEPNDLARLLDAPNLSVRALLSDGHVVSVALLAREGGLPADLREQMYEGGRVRGNMLPDVLTSQLRDEGAGVPRGVRVMRIATHHSARSRGLGSHLLDAIREEFSDDLDWLGVGYGATPELLSFWRENGFRTLHLSTTRNDTSGEHSAVMLAPLSDAGRALHDRTAERFANRIGAMLADSLDSLDPDVVRAALAATDAHVAVDLTDWEWRVVASAAYGPGMMDVSPRPFRELALKQLVAPETDLSPDQERLLVVRVLQLHDWRETAARLDHHSPRTCMKALGEAFQPLVDAYGTEAAREERERYTD